MAALKWSFMGDLKLLRPLKELEPQNSCTVEAWGDLEGSAVLQHHTLEMKGWDQLSSQGRSKGRSWAPMENNT